MLQQELSKQHADLVPGELPVPALGLCKGHSETIGVGIVGDDQLGVDRRRQLMGAIHSPRLFRVGEGNGREPPIRFELHRHRVHVGEAEPIQGGEHVTAPNAMHGGVHDGQGPIAGDLRQRRCHLIEVVVEELSVHLNGVIAEDLCHRHLVGRTDGGNGCGDLAVGRRDDLHGVDVVDLVPVVGGRVVARRDYDGGHGREVLGRIGNQRRRHRLREVHDFEAGGDQYGDDDVHEGL